MAVNHVGYTFHRETRGLDIHLVGHVYPSAHNLPSRCNLQQSCTGVAMRSAVPVMHRDAGLMYRLQL